MPWFKYDSGSPYRFKVYDIAGFKKFIVNARFIENYSRTYGYRFPLMRKLKVVPDRLLKSPVMQIEHWTIRVPVQRFKNSGWEYVGLYRNAKYYRVLEILKEPF